MGSAAGFLGVSLDFRAFVWEKRVMARVAAGGRWGRDRDLGVPLVEVGVWGVHCLEVGVMALLVLDSGDRAKRVGEVGVWLWGP